MCCCRARSASTPIAPAAACGAGYPALNPSRAIEEAVLRQIAALREGAGEDVEIYLDLNLNFRPEGYLRLARVLEERRPRLAGTRRRRSGDAGNDPAKLWHTYSIA